MKPRIEIKTVWKEMTDDQLRAKIAVDQIAVTSKLKIEQKMHDMPVTVGLEEPRAALVMRHFDKNALSKVLSGTESEAEVIRLCDEVLVVDRTNNFFNFARAALEKDLDKQKAYLQTAAKSVGPYHPSISGQAAAALVVHHYRGPTRVLEVTMDENYMKAQAWFVRAVALNDSEAVQQFCDFGTAYDNVATFKNLSVSNSQGVALVFLGLLFTGARIDKFDHTSLLTQKLESPGCLIPSPYRLAHALKNPLDALFQEGSPVRTIADSVVYRDARYFLSFFQYCAISAIIPPTVYLNVLNYMKTVDYAQALELGGELDAEITRVKAYLEQQKVKAQPAAVVQAPSLLGEAVSTPALLIDISSTTAQPLPPADLRSQKSAASLGSGYGKGLGIGFLFEKTPSTLLDTPSERILSLFETSDGAPQPSK